ncbi:sulfatase-like hydrolase/transferase [Candidatus Poribacteria bacterium]|nr:sulfatase-like hydrolase/transferase [Candidatus Poribacteria bacterium]
MINNINKNSLTRREFISTSLKTGAAAFTTGLFPNLQVNAKEKYNVLFLMVDDLRPMLRCYGDSKMYTPNIDRLAERGTLFKNNYCQFPVCNPSRASILTGLRPYSTGVHNNSGNFLQSAPNAITLPHHFKIHGYHTRSVGKITHGINAWFDKDSWSAPIWRSKWKEIDKSTSPSWQALDVDDDELDDGKITYAAIDVLNEIKGSQFFLAVGFNKPHLPFYAPRRYFDLYDIDSFHLPVMSKLPIDAPKIAANRKALHAYQDIDSIPPLSNEKTLELIKAYAANISYIDAQIGLIIDQLDSLSLSENTIILFCSDHGFQLGEHGMWRKSTLFEDCLHTPLIISIPSQKHKGVLTNAISEYVDIYPTLCDACELPIPQEIEGSSLLPVIDNPTQQWKSGAFSQYRRGDIDGLSIRTYRYRYTEWGNNGENGIELYDYEIDPEETKNIVNYSENIELVATLREQLNAGWQAALPDTIPTQSVLPSTLTWDVNFDGIVDINDLQLIATAFGSNSIEFPNYDFNKDGVIDIIDLLIVASHLGESSTISSPSMVSPTLNDVNQVEQWIQMYIPIDDKSPTIINGLQNLEQLVDAYNPINSALLPNFPNPSNPETWIPYDLIHDADVTIDIFNGKGEPIRKFHIGLKTKGTYRTQARALYWDGKNSIGEDVSSGVYFYYINAIYNNKSLLNTQFNSSRKMVIIK